MKENRTRELALQDYLDIFRRRWPIIVAIIALAVGAAAAATILGETTYDARADVLLRTNATNQLFPSAPDTGNRLVRQSQAELTYLRTDAYKAAAAEGLGRSASVSVNLVTDANVSDTGRIRFSNVDADPTRAAEAAQAYAQVYIDERNAADLEDLQRQLSDQIDEQAALTAELAALRLPIDEIEAEIGATDDPLELATLTTRLNLLLTQLGGDVARLDSQVNVVDDQIDQLSKARAAIADPSMTATISSAARVPTSPVSAGWVSNLLIALGVGTVVALGAALLREALDTHVHSDDDIGELLGVDVLGHVGQMGKAAKNGTLLINQQEPEPASMEAFRAIRSSVMFLQRKQRLGVIQVTSPTEANGKTNLACNLAVAFQQQGQSVLVIDADLRRPQVHRRFLVTGLEEGLASVLNDDLAFQDALRFDLVSGVTVLPAGGRPPNPSELLGSYPMARLLKLAHGEFDLVIVDSPPLLPVPDARLIAANVDGVVVVADPNVNSKKQLTDSKELLEQAGANLLGVVLNRVSDRGRNYRHAYGYSYD